MRRLFFALWPDQQVRQQCSRLIKSIQNCDGRAVRASNLHATLVFLGNVEAEAEASIISKAAALSIRNIVITFDCLSYWRNPGILCLTAQKEPVAELTVLVEQIKKLVMSSGVSVEDRAFVPHITLFRKVRRPLQTEFEPIVWQSDAFMLVESCSLPEGVRYRVLQDF